MTQPMTHVSGAVVYLEELRNGVFWTEPGAIVTSDGAQLVAPPGIVLVNDFGGALIVADSAAEAGAAWTLARMTVGAERGVGDA
mgnify:CR=1 FL=1